MSVANLSKTGTESVAGPGKSDKAPTPASLTENANPSYRRRMMTTLAFPLLMLLAVPYWWYTTSIVRLSLPIDRISALESATVSPWMSLCCACLTQTVADRNKYPLAKTKILFTADVESYPKPAFKEISVDHLEVLENLKNTAEKSIDSLLQQKRPKSTRVWELDPWTKRMGALSPTLCHPGIPCGQATVIGIMDVS